MTMYHTSGNSAQTASGPSKGERPNPHWALSIVAGLLFFPVGLIALLFSYLSHDRNEKGEVIEAHRFSRYPRNSALTLFVLEGVAVVVVIVLTVAGLLWVHDIQSQLPDSVFQQGTVLPNDGGRSGSVTVPKLAGLDNVNASAVLSKAGLQPAEQDRASSTIGFGNVVSSSPAAGTKVRSGTTVMVTISCGQYAPGICR
jgi:hypothetical protein